MRVATARTVVRANIAKAPNLIGLESASVKVGVPHHREPGGNTRAWLFFPTDPPRTPYDKAIWDGLTAMWAFEHVRNLGKGLLSCQQRILVPCVELSTYYTNLFDNALPFWVASG